MERMSRSIQRFVDVSGLRKVADGFNWIARAAGNVLRSLSAMVPVLGALTSAATIAGMYKLVGSFAEWSHTLVQNADQIGVTTQQLQQFQDATKLAGGNANDMTDALKSLHTASANAFIGTDTQAIQWFNKLGIAWKDANGNLRNTADLLPEVIQKISEMKDPADRARASAALLGDANAKLVEDFRQSHRSFSDWLRDAQNYKDLTDDQVAAFQRFSEAQGKLGVTFEHLGQQIAVVLASNFTPLMNKFAEFVNTNSPQIVAAVDNLSKEFAHWIDNIDWPKVEKGAQTVLDTLQFIITHLNTILEVAGAVAGVFVIKWGVDVVKAIGAVVEVLGAAGGGAAAAGGTGLLGALGSVAAIAGAIGAGVAAKKGLEAGSEAVETGVFGKERVEERKKLQEQGSEQFWGWLGHPFGLGKPAAPPGGVQKESFVPGQMNLPQAQTERGAGIRDRLATDLGISKDQAAGVVGNLQAESGLQAINEKRPLIPGSRGGFGWAQWTGPRRTEFEAYAKEHNLDPKSDEANYGFLVQELKNDPKLLAQIRGAKTAGEAARITEAGYERPTVSNAATRARYAEQIAATPTPTQVAQAGPAPTPPAPAPAPMQLAEAMPSHFAPIGTAAVQTAPPLSGAVNVSITGKNLPPNTAVTAQGSGAVNVEPPRVEHQNLSTV